MLSAQEAKERAGGTEGRKKEEGKGKEMIGGKHATTPTIPLTSDVDDRKH